VEGRLRLGTRGSSATRGARALMGDS
jgi:hypothetical protein